jgi:CelD/BcsL family acetyltransferase involved in cellulose biosynthesis
MLTFQNPELAHTKVSKSSTNDFTTTINSETEVHCIQTVDSFAELKDDWNRLVSESINPHPFILWEWMYSWWETYHQENHDKLAILAMYRNSELVALAPFYIKSKGFFLKRLSLLGEGENIADAAVTTYPDLIVKEQYRDQAISAFTKKLKKYRLDSLKFNYASFNLIQENSVLKELGECFNDDFTTLKKHSENQFVINLPKNEDEYIESLSKSTRKQFRMKLRRLKKEGSIEITSEDNLNTGLLTIETLQHARSSHLKQKNPFDSECFKIFHKKLTEHFKHQEILQIRVMKHDDTPIAAAYNFYYKGSCYSYLSGFKSSNDRRFSPMFILDMLEIQNLIKRQYDRYDLLVSESQNNYKTKFGSDVNSVYKIHWFRKGLISTGMITYLKVRPLLAKVYHLYKQ